MADLLGAMRVEIVGDNSKLDKSIKDSKANTEKFGKSTEKLGASLGKLFTGIGFAVVAKKLFDLGKQAENLFQIQETAEAKLDATLLATGHAAGLTADELKKMAAELQKVTTFGDEATIGAQSLLLTFKDIGGDVFPRALESILDVSEAMGQDLKTSTIQIGKALNDPVAGLSALSRVGIQFTDVQKDLIKGFAESGDKASAQGIILEELESQFGGVAEAAALTAEGIEKQLNNAYGDLLETIGSVISEGMIPFRVNLRKEVESVNVSIQALILRRKALAGEATLVENLTLKQIELQRAKDNQIAQDKAEEDQLERLNELREGAVEQYIGERKQLELREQAIGNVNRVIDGEVAALERSVAAIQTEINEEKALMDANFQLAQGIISVTDETKAGTDALGENTEENVHWLDVERSARDIRIERKIAEFDYIEALTQSTEELDENTEAADENTAARFRNVNAIRDYETQLKNASFAHIEFTELQENSRDGMANFEFGMGIATSSLESLGQALVSEGFTFKTFGKIAVSALASVLSGLGAQLAAAAALSFFPIFGIPRPGKGAGQLAASGAAFLAAGVLRGAAASFQDGGIVAGSSFSGDNVPAMVNSGEMVLNRSQQAQLFAMANGSGGTTNNNNNQSINVNALFSLGNDAQIRQAAKTLFPALVNEGQRRGASIV